MAVDIQTIVPLDGLRESDAARFGAKAATLGEMSARGFLVPPGFAISTEEWRTAVNVGVPPTVSADLCRRLEQEFDSLGAPQVAVRSSAAYEDSSVSSWAGKLVTVLGSTRTSVIDAIERVWNSVFAARVQAYGDDAARAGVAVLVQELVPPDFSGVAFSLNPVSGDRDIVAVEGVSGLGEALVSGRVTPTRFHINQQSFEIVYAERPQQVHALRALRGGTAWTDDGILPIPNSMAIEVARMAVAVEHALKRPVDIEWAFSAGKLFLLQARPITAIGTNVFSNRPTIAQFKRTFAARGVSLLATDIHMRIYGRYEVVMLQIDGEYEKWSGPRGLAEAATEGYSFYADEQRVSSLTQDVEDILNETLHRLGTAARASQPNEFFRESDRFIETYRFFNSEFVDGVVLAARSDPTLLPRLDIVTRYKNRLRELLNTIYFSTDGPLSILVRDVANKNGRDVEDVLFSTSSEVISLRLPNADEVLRRRSAYAELLVRGDLAVISGEEARSLRRTVAKTSGESLLGTVANAPLARLVGTAYVLDVDFSDIAAIARAAHEIPLGAILVCKMAGPEIDEVCLKAGAIVNEIGGLLTHAMIISRERGIPCIVGVDNACEAIHTGDVLELDLATGAVSIIARTNAN